MGRKRVPSSLKLVTGTHDKGGNSQQDITAEPRRIARGLPKPPKYLDEDAKEEWMEVVQDLYDCGILSTTDRMILANYCQAVSHWKGAELAFQEEKAMNPDGAYHSSLLGVANRTLSIVAKLCSDLGMTPSARSRIVALPREREEDPADKYLDRAS